MNVTGPPPIADLTLRIEHSNGERASQIGRDMLDLIAELYPICRSITGDGVRRSLDILERTIPLTRSEIPTGTRVFDWEVPKEWNIRDACIMNMRGERVVDFRLSNLHVVNYSTPIHAVVPLSELREHLFSIPEHPTWIPYRTTYYQETWGFCVTQRQLESLTDDEYEVVIDSSLTDGTLTYAECFLPGTSTDEVLVTSHICHPSLCNDNLSGVSVAVFLAQSLLNRPHRYSYRFLFGPGTIGAITFLARNQEQVARVRHGLVLTCIGDRGAFHYKRSRRGAAEIDRVVALALRDSGNPHEILEFSPYGYDERQFCSPGFNMPVGCLMRSVWGRFPEYHTSADDLEFVSADALNASFDLVRAVLDILEQNRTYRSTNPCCEPALGRRGLYRTTGGGDAAAENMAHLWVLNLADGEHSLVDIAETSGLRFSVVSEAASRLAGHGLLIDADTEAS